MPEWLIQTMLTTALSVTGWVLLRAVRSIERLETNASLLRDHVQAELAALRLKLAEDYVTHANLNEMKRDQRRAMRVLTEVRIYLTAIATQMKVKLPPLPALGDEHDGDEG